MGEWKERKGEERTEKDEEKEKCKGGKNERGRERSRGERMTYVCTLKGREEEGRKEREGEGGKRREVMAREEKGGKKSVGAQINEGLFGKPMLTCSPIYSFLLLISHFQPPCPMLM